MNNFIVVEVSQLDGEYVDDVKFISSFESYEKAQEFVNEERKISQERAKERHEYIKEFALTLPDEYTHENSFYFPERLRTQRQLSEYIEYNKSAGIDIELLKDYNPPEFIRLRDLRIVEIN